MPTKKVLPPVAEKKKPSLASLKPDKATNIRARKNAVKKIETHVSKKSSSKKSPIVVRKKTETTGLGVKRVSPKAKTKKSTTKEPEVLVLPTNMSIRAREKALVILEQVTKDFNRPAQQVAYVSGLCFMLVGATMSLAFSGTLSGAEQSALLASSTSQTTTTQFVKAVAPELSLLDPLPTVLTASSEHKLAVLSAKDVQVKAQSLDTGEVLPLFVDNLSGELYTFVIEKDKFTGGRYTLTALVESAIDSSKHKFRLGEISVPVINTQTTSGTSGSATTTTTIPVSTNTSTETEEVEESESETEEIESVESVATTTPVTTSSGPTLKLLTPGSALFGDSLIKIEAPKDIPFVEVYIRQPQSSNKRFVGLAEKRSDYWYFFFKTTNVPNGEYEITARTRYSGKDYFSPGVTAKISNFIETKVEIVEPEVTSDVDVPENTESVEAPVGRSLPDFSITSLVDGESESSDISSAPAELQNRLSEYSDEIRTLLNRYAVAKQSGDALAVELATKELENRKREIINSILLDSSVNHLGDDAEQVLSERFSTLQKRVETFEELRKTASNGSTAIDTDKDGISDFDEQNLYSTDPALPDTDNDGVIDGVEIMRGFDPLNSDVNSIITYELPSESLGIVEESVFKINAVVPVIKNDEETGKSVQAEISGTALPNSYVTLYVFSSPTIVTVRADENGVFSYTFEKELEDGEHEVYVAITDNTGAIVARSNPFRFVKQAEAFTPINGTVEPTTNDAVISLSPLNTYNTVVGLGILAFGIILLMLGVSMREKTGLKSDVPSHDLKTS